MRILIWMGQTCPANISRKFWRDAFWRHHKRSNQTIYSWTFWFTSCRFSLSGILYYGKDERIRWHKGNNVFRGGYNSWSSSSWSHTVRKCKTVDDSRPWENIYDNIAYTQWIRLLCEMASFKCTWFWITTKTGTCNNSRIQKQATLWSFQL